MKKRGWLLDRVYKRVKGDRGGSVSREGHHDIDSLVAEGFAAERTTVRSTKKIPQAAREPRNTGGVNHNATRELCLRKS